jgi:histidinol-phosphate aminotransferase
MLLRTQSLTLLLVTLNSKTAASLFTSFNNGPFAKAVLDELGRRGIFLRMPGVAPLDRCIRFGVGLPAELDVLERELPAVIAAT